MEDSEEVESTSNSQKNDQNHDQLTVPPIRTDLHVNERHHNRPPDVEQVDIVANITEVLTQALVEHLNNLISQWIDDTSQDSRRVAFVASSRCPSSFRRCQIFLPRQLVDVDNVIVHKEE